MAGRISGATGSTSELSNTSNRCRQTEQQLKKCVFGGEETCTCTDIQGKRPSAKLGKVRDPVFSGRLEV